MEYEWFVRLLVVLSTSHVLIRNRGSNNPELRHEEITGLLVMLPALKLNKGGSVISNASGVGAIFCTKGCC